MLTFDEMEVFERVDKIHHGLESLEADRSAFLAKEATND